MTPHASPSFERDPGGVPGGPTSARHFLGWDGPALPAAAAWLLDRARDADSGDRLDLGRFRVVLPGSRAARRLLELLVEGADGRAILPPDLVTVGSLPERLYRPALPTPRPEVAEAAWRGALADLAPDDLARLVPAPPESGDTLAWGALAATVAGLHAQVGGEGHAFGDVAERCRGELLFNDEERWRALARGQRRVRAVLDRSGFRDREAARLDALGRGLEVPPAGTPDTLVLVGVVEIPGVVRRFLGAWPGGIEVLVHAPSALADRFDALGAVVPDAWDDALLRIPEPALRVVDRPAHQALAVVEHLRGLEGTRAAEEIAVGVPDDAVVPYLAAALEDAGVPARYAGGRPLPTTAPFLLLDAVAELLDGWSFDAFAALVRHPDLAGALELEVPLPWIADHYQSRHLQAVLEGKMPGRPEDPLWAVRRALEKLLAPMRGAAPMRTLSAWGPPIRELVGSLYPGRTLDRGDPADRDLVAFAHATATVLEGFESIPPGLDPRAVPGHVALRLLLARLRDVVVPPPADEGAVELLGWLELHLDDAPVMVVTGVNEPFLPESVTGDPFLPHALLSRLGMADNRRRRARDLYLLSAILASRPETQLVAGRRDAAGNPLRLSRLLLADEPEVVASRIVRLLEGEAPGAGEHPVDPAPADEPAPDTPFTLPPDPVLSAAGGPPDRIAVTAFRTLLADPYRYAMDRVLRLEEVTDEARELDPMAFGSLAHEVLEAWAERPDAHAMSEPEIVQALDHALDEAFDDRFGARPLPALRLQREQLRARLHRYAEVQAGRNREGWIIARVEAAPAGEGVAFPVDGVPILLRGRIDRVDHHPASGRWQLLDIKTTEKARTPEEVHRRGSRNQKRWVDLQLPLYLLLARALRSDPGTGAQAGRGPGEPAGPLIPPGAPVETGYILLPGAGDEVQVAVAEWTTDELQSAWEAAADAVRILRANRFEWDPSAPSPGPFDPLARVLGKGVLRQGDFGDAEGTDDE
jgi:ATP-dependent helicase/nuclease subunit B